MIHTNFVLNTDAMFCNSLKLVCTYWLLQPPTRILNVSPVSDVSSLVFTLVLYYVTTYNIVLCSKESFYG